MPNRQEEYFINELLNQLAARVYRNRRQTRILGPDGYRVIDDLIDDTGLGPNSETDVQVIHNEFILDCGHRALNNLGGRCHYCDSLVCRQCIFICASCGLAVCNIHSVVANFDGQAKKYCRQCAQDIRRQIRLQALGAAAVSFFITSDR